MSTTPTKIHIRSAGDLISALLGPDFGVRLGILQAIRRNPEAALAYGKYQGRDVIDELIHQAYQEYRYTYWKAVVEALAGFKDSRVVVFFLKLVTVSQQPEIIRLAAARLAQEPPEGMHGHLATILRGDENAVRGRAAAGLLATSTLLTAEERVRVEMLAGDPEADPLPLEDAPLEVWLPELDGRYAREARACLERRGEGAFVALKARWEELSEESKAWLLRWGAHEHPLESVDLLRKALESGSDGLAEAALEGVAALGPAAVLFRPLLRRFREHPDERIREAAARAEALGSSEGMGSVGDR